MLRSVLRVRSLCEASLERREGDWKCARNVATQMCCVLRLQNGINWFIFLFTADWGYHRVRNGYYWDQPTPGGGPGKVLQGLHTLRQVSKIDFVFRLSVAGILVRETSVCLCFFSSFIGSTEDAESIFREVVALNMTSPGYVWIVSEQALLAPNKPDGQST